MASGGSAFDAHYFEHGCGRPYRRDDHWLAHFARIADRIVAGIAPARVLDAGCAIGLLVEALRDRGVEAWGVDVSAWAIANVPEPVRAFCREGSIAAPFDRRYDLITCIEVVEHMPAADGEAAIANLCAHADDVLFSSSPVDYREPTHVNVQPPEHWGELFARHGFFRDVEFDAAFLTAWAVRYRRSTEPLPRIVRGFERRLARCEHERSDMRAFTAEALAAQVSAEAMLAHTRDALMKDIEALRAEDARLRRHAAELGAEAGALRQQARELGERARFAEATVANMQQSVFWKLRRWFGRG